MGYKPIFDLSCDVTSEDSSDLITLLNATYSLKLVITQFTTSPNGDYDVTIRGTMSQIVSWLREYYASSEVANIADTDVMHWANQNLTLEQIA